MSTLSDFKAALQPGAVLEVTNHFITREDHPAFGTTFRRVAAANSSACYVEYVEAERQNAQRWGWPKASEIARSGDTWNIDYPNRPGVAYLSVKVVGP